MCLYTKNKKAKTASEDLVCYKVLIKNYGTHSCCVTPYAGYVVEFDKELVADGQKSINHLRMQDFHTNYGVKSGFFHTYENYNDALMVARDIKLNKRFTSCYVAKCIIPKGTNYYDGLTACGYCKEYVAKSYASERLILKSKGLKVVTFS